MKWGSLKLFCSMCGKQFLLSGHYMHGIRHSKEYGYLCSIECYKVSELKYARMILGKDDESIKHGTDCLKHQHESTGHLHAEDDDSPYDVDGVEYCGRCHEVLP